MKPGSANRNSARYRVLWAAGASLCGAALLAQQPVPNTVDPKPQPSTMAALPADVRLFETPKKAADALIETQVRAGLVTRMAVLYDLLTTGPVPVAVVEPLEVA